MTEELSSLCRRMLARDLAARAMLERVEAHLAPLAAVAAEVRKDLEELGALRARLYPSKNEEAEARALRAAKVRCANCGHLGSSHSHGAATTVGAWLGRCEKCRRKNCLRFVWPE
jgi:hypothetical protein